MNGKAKCLKIEQFFFSATSAAAFFERVSNWYYIATICCVYLDMGMELLFRPQKYLFVLSRRRNVPVCSIASIFMNVYRISAYIL